MSPPAHDVTELLQAWGRGDLDAHQRVVALVYEELRRRAAVHLRRERQGHTLQPTALVHEAYLRLVDQRRAVWQNRAQFLAVASQMMRRILIDRARARKRAKRPGDRQVPLADVDLATQPVGIDLLDLDVALTKLEAFDPQEPHRGTPILRRSHAGGDRPRARRLAGHRRTRLAGCASVAVQDAHRASAGCR